MQTSSYTGHVEQRGAPAQRVVSHDATSITVTKLSVGPMDNNCYVLTDTGSGTGIVIDAANDAERILDALGDVDVTTILTTHHHHDHWQALAAVARATDARVLLHAEEQSHVPVPVDGTVTHGDRISLGTACIEILHTPGHTDGSVCAVLSGPAQDRPDITTHVFTGDTLFPGGPGKTNGDGAFARIIESLRTELFTFDDDTWIYPGHGDDTTIGAERPHLDAWQARGW